MFDKDKKAMEFLNEQGASVARIPNDTIKNLPDENRLPLLPFHTHGARHFLTIEYTDTDRDGRIVVINDAREIVAVTEVEIGKRLPKETSVVSGEVGRDRAIDMRFPIRA